MQEQVEESSDGSAIRDEEDDNEVGNIKCQHHDDVNVSARVVLAMSSCLTLCVEVGISFV